MRAPTISYQLYSARKFPPSQLISRRSPKSDTKPLSLMVRSTTGTR